MSEGPDNLVLQYLRRIDQKMDRLIEDVGDQMSIGGVQRRIDRVEQRLDRIERRLDIIEQPPGVRE